MNKAYRTLATIAVASFLVGCSPWTKTLSKLLNVKVNEVTDLVIIYNPENKVCEYNLEKKGAFLEKLLNTNVRETEACDCLGLYNITFTAGEDSYRINQYYAKCNNKHYNIKTIDEKGIDNLVVSFLEGSLQLC